MKIDTFVQDRLQLVKISNASTFFTSVPTSPPIKMFLTPK